MAAPLCFADFFRVPAGVILPPGKAYLYPAYSTRWRAPFKGKFSNTERPNSMQKMTATITLAKRQPLRYTTK